MESKLSFLILAYCPIRNRQGIDLNELLNSRPWQFQSKLIQLGMGNDGERKIIGIPMSPEISGWRLRFMSRWARLQMFVKGFKIPHHVVVALNIPSLLPAVFLKLFFKSKLVFYSLEYHVVSPLNRMLLRRFCDAIINVEETRCELLKKQIGKSTPSTILHNVPRFVEWDQLTPKLRKWLIENKQFSGDEFLAIYSGSYQKYSNLEAILEWAQEMPKQAWLIMMLTEVPERLAKKRYEKTILISAKSHADLYHWLVDADLSLLPYESDDDNVRYCSPQKLFDALACGVPVLGSRRPLIEKVVDKYHCGLTIEFKSKNEFLQAIEWFTCQSRPAMRQRAREGHHEYNYRNYSDRMLCFFRDLS